MIKKGGYPEDKVLEIVKKHLEGGQYIDHQHMDRIWKYGLERKSKKRNEGTLENQGKSNVLNDTFNTKAGIGKRALPIFDKQSKA